MRYCLGYLYCKCWATVNRIIARLHGKSYASLPYHYRALRYDLMAEKAKRVQ